MKNIFKLSLRACVCARVQPGAPSPANDQKLHSGKLSQEDDALQEIPVISSHDTPQVVKRWVKNALGEKRPRPCNLYPQLSTTTLPEHQISLSPKRAKMKIPRKILRLRSSAAVSHVSFPMVHPSNVQQQTTSYRLPKRKCPTLTLGTAKNIVPKPPLKPHLSQQSLHMIPNLNSSTATILFLDSI